MTNSGMRMAWPRVFSEKRRHAGNLTTNQAVSLNDGVTTMKAISSTIILSVLATCLVGRLSGSESLESIQLPPPETSGAMPLMQALNNRMSTKEFTTQTLPREQLSNLLWAAFGINRPESGKRTAATAVNCQDIDVYVVLENAVYVSSKRISVLRLGRFGRGGTR